MSVVVSDDDTSNKEGSSPSHFILASTAGLGTPALSILLYFSMRLEEEEDDDDDDADEGGGKESDVLVVVSDDDTSNKEGSKPSAIIFACTAAIGTPARAIF